MGRVIVVGSVNEDLLLRAPIPAPGETVEATEPVALLCGGKGANAAVASARAGAETHLVGCIGDDPAGRDALEDLAAENVGTTHLTVRPGVSTGRAVVIVDSTGENAIVVAPGANALLDPVAVEASVAALAAPGAVVLSNLEVPAAATAAAARAASANHMRFVLDPAPARPLTAALLPPDVVVVPNEVELEQLGGLPAELLGRGAGAVVVTLGARGADIFTREGGPSVSPRRIPAPPTRAVDTTGAGDAFRGALVAALAGDSDLDAAVVLGVAAGSRATTVIGARKSCARSVRG